MGLDTQAPPACLVHEPRDALCALAPSRAHLCYCNELSGTRSRRHRPKLCAVDDGVAARRGEVARSRLQGVPPRCSVSDPGRTFLSGSTQLWEPALRPAKAMLRAQLGADKLAETELGCPEDGGAEPHPDTAAGRSPEDGRAEDMLRLQQEVSGLREEFRRQEARWAAAHRELRAQMDVLVKQNLELQAGLRASERQSLEAKRSEAGSVHVRRCSDTRVPGPLFAAQSISPRAACLALGGRGTSHAGDRGLASSGQLHTP
ncbi:T-complex protein 10A homolog 2-like [Dama dama]